MQCLIASDYVIIVYEPPNINLPNIIYADYEKIKTQEGLNVKVKNCEELKVDTFELLDIPEVIQTAVEQ